MWEECGRTSVGEERFQHSLCAARVAFRARLQLCLLRVVRLRKRHRRLVVDCPKDSRFYTRCNRHHTTIPVSSQKAIYLLSFSTGLQQGTYAETAGCSCTPALQHRPGPAAPSGRRRPMSSIWAGIPSASKHPHWRSPSSTGYGVFSMSDVALKSKSWIHVEDVREAEARPGGVECAAPS